MQKSKMPLVIVCIDGHPNTLQLLRSAKSKAEVVGGGWVALHIEMPEHIFSKENTNEYALHFLTLAKEMGGQVVQRRFHNVAKGIALYVEEVKRQGYTIECLIMGEAEKGNIISRFLPPIAITVRKKIDKAIEVQVIFLSANYTHSGFVKQAYAKHVPVKGMALAVVAVLGSILCAEALRGVMPAALFELNNYNVMLIFLIACATVSLRYGLIPGLFSAVLGFLSINFFYMVPFYEVKFSDVKDVINLSLFLIAAGVISFLGSYTRAHIKALHTREKRSQALYKIYRSASEAQDKEQALILLHDQLSRYLKLPVVFFLSSTSQPDKLSLMYPDNCEIAESDKEWVNVLWRDIKAQGYGVKIQGKSSWRWEPLMGSRGEIGIMGVNVSPETIKGPSFWRMMSILADQAASILERVELVKMMGESRLREEQEKLRSMLLSSVSHDLKTPLASVIGSLNVYRRLKASGKLTEIQAEELTSTALDEAERLDSFITNILEMTRIESGDIEFRKEWHHPEDIVLRVKKRLRQRLRYHEVIVHVPPVLPEVEMDIMVTESVLQNILDNAAKYTPKETIIEISLREGEEGFFYEIRDHGEGIPEDKLDIIFDKYERLHKTDRNIAGTGLGLAICKSLMKAQGGDIRAKNHGEGGAVFLVSLPNTRKVLQKQAA